LQIGIVFRILGIHHFLFKVTRSEAPEHDAKLRRACESTGACLARWNPAQGCPTAESLVSFVGEDGREELCTCTVKPKRVYTKALSASRSVRSKRTHHQTSWENVFRQFSPGKKCFLVFPFAECVSQCLKTLKFRILA